ncbi:MAG: chemotaxis-specific protein-glutamate methyltransferase CheB [Desulfococcaceae bacterium]
MDMKPVRVLVVDDSIFARELITAILSEDSGIQVAGQAVNGADALKKVEELRPDIVTMDVDMPVMDGLEAISRIMSSHALPILVVTSRADANTAWHAISKGALEVIPKPDVNEVSGAEFSRKVRMLARVKVISHIRRDCSPRMEAQTHTYAGDSRPGTGKLVAIASSTGGPKALSILLSALPENFPCPIVIAQHIAADFVSGMVNWLDKIVSLKVKTGVDGESLVPGTVYISPSEKHMRAEQGKRIGFAPVQTGDIYFPSCNILLTSAAEVYGSGCIGIILTGMGDDGISGLRAIKDAGGFTIAQDEQTSVIFGMPRVAIEKGCADKVLPIHKIAEEIMFRVTGK